MTWSAGGVQNKHGGESNCSPSELYIDLIVIKTAKKGYFFFSSSDYCGTAICPTGSERDRGTAERGHHLDAAPTVNAEAHRTGRASE